MSAAQPLFRPPHPDEQNPEGELFELFGNAPLAVAQCSSEGTITAINPALRRLLGRELPLGPQPLCFDDLVHPDHRRECEVLFRELIAGRRESFQLENKTAGASGTWARWTAWRLEQDGSEPAGALLVAEDTTEARQAEQRLRQAERLEAVGRLAGGVAHDFNNLLTGVLLYCDLLLDGLEGSHLARKYAEEIRAASLQASGMVRQLLAVARPQTCIPRPVCLNEIAQGMRNLLVRLIGENIELKLHLDRDLGLVRMDPAQAQQILLNLVLNARDALLDGGEIVVETRNCKVQLIAASRISGSHRTSLPCALIVVSDNGKGMDSQTREHLFEAFFTTKAPGKGTGLGLATVHDIVTSNGGLVHVESEPGKGTRVSVLLPRAPDAALHSLCAKDWDPAGSNPAPSTQPKEQTP